MEQITSLTYLLSTAGTVALVTLITQYVKSLLPERLPIRVLVLLLCMLMQVGLTLVISPQLEPLILAVANSFVAAAASMGTYEVTFNKD